MAGLDDLSIEQLEDLLKKKRSTKRVRVREYEVDESDFRSWFGIGEKSDDDASGSDDDDDSKEKPKRKGYFG